VLRPNQTFEFTFEIDPETEDAVVAQIEILINVEKGDGRNFEVYL